MSADKDFAPENPWTEEELSEEHRELVALSGIIADVVEGLRTGGYSPEETGRLIKQEVDKLGEMAEERVRERYLEEGV